MNLGKSLAISAMTGILSAAACGGVAADAKSPTSDPAVGSAGEKHQCGNHDGGSCGAKDTTPQPAK